MEINSYNDQILKGIYIKVNAHELETLQDALLIASFEYEKFHNRGIGKNPYKPLNDDIQFFLDGK